MEVFADILFALGKVLIHLFEPLVWLVMGFWRWWTTELPEVLTYEEPTPQPEEWDTTKTPAKTYYIICIAFVLLLQILLLML